MKQFGVPGPYTKKGAIGFLVALPITQRNAPNATDPELQRAYGQMWKEEDKMPGGTIGELIREAEEKRELKHMKKAVERLAQLVNRVVSNNPPLSHADRVGAERVINDLKRAIKIAQVLSQ